MADPKILDMPVKLGLELMAVIGPDLTNAKRELLDDMIDEINGIGLGVFFVDFQCANAGCIVDCSVLEAANFLSLFAFESQELDIHLDMMAWHLFWVPLRVNLPHPGARADAVLRGQAAAHPRRGDALERAGRHDPDARRPWTKEALKKNNKYANMIVKQQ